MKRIICVLSLYLVCHLSVRAQELIYSFDKDVPVQWKNPERTQSGELDAYPGLVFSNVWFAFNPETDNEGNVYTGKAGLAYSIRNTSTGSIQRVLEELSSLAFHVASENEEGANFVVEVNGVPCFYNSNSVGIHKEYIIPFNLPLTASVSITNRSKNVLYFYDLTINNSTHPNGIEKEKDLSSIVITGDGLHFSIGDIRIYSLSGLLLIYKGETDYCSTRQLEKGIYIAEWMCGNKKQTTKFCVY